MNGVYEMLYQNVDELYTETLYDMYNSEWTNDNLEDKNQFATERADQMAKNYALTVRELALKENTDFETVLGLMVKSRFLEIHIEALRNVRNSIDLGACNIEYARIDTMIRSAVLNLESFQNQLNLHLKEIKYNDIEAI